MGVYIRDFTRKCRRRTENLPLENKEANEVILERLDQANPGNKRPNVSDVRRRDNDVRRKND